MTIRRKQACDCEFT